MFDIQNLPKELIVGNGIELLLDTKMHRGINGLKNIVWYEYKIVNHKEKGLVYNNICLSPFKITEEIRSLAAKNIIEKNISSQDTPLPNIDYRSGNIHPSREFIERLNFEKVLQLVLCNGLGPNTPNENEEDAYIYKNSPLQKGAKVHKACYFPLIEDDQNLYEDWRYKLLQEVWLSIPADMRGI